jgi:hypothetical protein
MSSIRLLFHSSNPKCPERPRDLGLFQIAEPLIDLLFLAGIPGSECVTAARKKCTLFSG